MMDDLHKPQKRWNAENYKQFNIALRPTLIEAFREACVQNNMPMRAVLVSLMSDYASQPPSLKNQKDEHNYDRRNKRRKAVGMILSQLEDIRTAESQYMENMPENFRNSSRYEAAMYAVDSIDAAINSLSNAFDG